MTIDITTLFVCLDDFCKLYENAVQAKALPVACGKKRQREGYLSLSEMLLIEIYFHFSPYKDFKHYYLYGICLEHRNKFKKLPCYERFVAIKKDLFLPLSILLHLLFGEESGLYFADSTSLDVCHSKRASRHKVFKGLAEHGKTSTGWFYGLKLHLILNHKAQLVAVRLTPGNTDDRKALLTMVKDLKGKCFADKGYIGKDIFKILWKKGFHLITGLRKNMKQHLMPLLDKILLRKRFIIETTFAILKEDLGLEHTRHRSPLNAFIHILSTLVAYSFKTKKTIFKIPLILSYP